MDTEFQRVGNDWHHRRRRDRSDRPRRNSREGLSHRSIKTGSGGAEDQLRTSGGDRGPSTCRKIGGEKQAGANGGAEQRRLPVPSSNQQVAGMREQSAD